MGRRSPREEGVTVNIWLESVAETAHEAPLKNVSPTPASPAWHAKAPLGTRTAIPAWHTDPSPALSTTRQSAHAEKHRSVETQNDFPRDTLLNSFFKKKQLALWGMPRTYIILLPTSARTG